MKKNSSGIARVSKLGARKNGNSGICLQPFTQQNYFESDDERLERMLRFQKEVKAKYNDISVTMNTVSKDEPYKVSAKFSIKVITVCSDQRE